MRSAQLDHARAFNARCQELSGRGRCGDVVPTGDHQRRGRTSYMVRYAAAHEIADLQVSILGQVQVGMLIVELPDLSIGRRPLPRVNGVNKLQQFQRNAADYSVSRKEKRQIRAWVYAYNKSLVYIGSAPGT